MAMISALIRSCLWIHLISLIAIALQPSTPATILGRYSRTSALILAIFVVLTPIVYLGTRWLAKRIDSIHLSQWQYVAVFVAGCGVVAACWLPNIGVTSSYIIVRLYLTFTLVVMLVWALMGLKLSSGWVRAGAIAGFGLLLILVVAATRFPGLLWTDEGYMVTVALGFTRTGHLTPLYWLPAQVESFSLNYMGLSLWFRLFGVDLFTGRLFIFVLALITLRLIYVTVRGIYSKTAAWSCVILGAGGFIFHNYLRTDIGVALFLSVAFYFYTLAQRKEVNWPHLWVGLAVGLSLDGHPNAYRFGMGFGLAYGIEYMLQLARQRRFFIYWPIVYLVIGGLTGVGAYFLFYSVITTYFTSVAQTAKFAFSFNKAWDVLIEQFNTALRTTPLLLGAALLGIVVAVRRHTAFDRLLVTVLVTSVASIAILYGYTRSYYLIHNIVPLVLLAGGLFWELERRSNTAVLGGINIALVVATCTLVVSGMRSATGQGYTNILAFADPIREVVPKDMVVVGVDPLYIPMYDYPHFVEMTGPSWAALRSGTPEPVVWEQINPEAIIVVRDYPIPPFATMLNYIDEHKLVLVHCWANDEIGRIDLYMKTGSALQSGQCEPVGEG